MRRRLFVIFNPGAGVSHSLLFDDTLRALQRAGAAVTHTRPASVAAARLAAQQAAASGDYDAIVAAGGDGTIRQVAAALVDGEMPLGIIPAGTGNVLAHEIGLKPAAEAVARTLLHGPTMQATCASANGEPFLLMAGAGFDARVLTGLDQRTKSLLGKLAYAAPLIGGLARPLDTLSLAVDGRPCQASWAVVANACHYGGGFVLTKRTGIHQRGLVAMLFKARSRTALAGMLTSLARGRLDEHAARRGHVEILPCSDVTISSDTSVPVQIDGDVVGATPLTIHEGTSHVRLIVPPDSPSGRRA